MQVMAKFNIAKQLNKGLQAWDKSLREASKTRPISAEPAMFSWPAESPHDLGGMTKIINQIKPKACLPRQILKEGERVVVWVLMGIGLKLASPLVTRMGLEPRATLLQSKKSCVENTGRCQNGLKMLESSEN